MTARDFAFWLQGLFELARPESLTKEQTDLVRRHLAMVFKHEIDPSMGDKEHQKRLDDLHKAVDDAKKHPHPPIGGQGPNEIRFRC